jgi:3'-5' exoribonuclease
MAILINYLFQFNMKELELTDESVIEDLQKLAFLINNIKNEHIRQFVIDVFTNKEIIKKFAVIPASAKHHHNYKGGLIKHSNECGNKILAMKHLMIDSLEVDLGICCSLLHDVGKIKTLDNNGLTAYGRCASHEDYTVAILQPYFDELSEKFPKATLAILYILTYEYQQHRYPTYPVINLIKMADRYSAGIDQQKKSFKGKPDCFHFSKIPSGSGFQHFNRLVA